MGSPLNGASTEARLAQVITFRNLAARLKEVYHERLLAEDSRMSVALAVWFQQFLQSEPSDFWERCFRHLDGSVQPDTLRLWMGYPESWEVPRALRGTGIDCGKIRFLGAWGVYPIGGEPRDKRRVGGSLPDGTYAAEASVSRHGTYVRGAVGDPPLILDGWHRLYRRPKASRAAVSRCLRMCVLSRLVGRRLGSSKELLIAEAQAFLQWALVSTPAGDGRPALTTLAAPAAAVMRALLLDDTFVVLVHQLPRRSGA